MNTQQKALKECVKALNESLTYIESPSWSPSMARDCRDAITQAKQALEVQAQGETAYWSEVIGMFVARLNHGTQTITAPDVLALLNDCQYLGSLTNPQASEPSKDAKTWCEYVAGMIGGYLNEPVDSDKCKAMAGIIERRLWALPATPTGEKE